MKIVYYIIAYQPSGSVMETFRRAGYKIFRDWERLTVLLVLGKT